MKLCDVVNLLREIPDMKPKTKSSTSSGRDQKRKRLCGMVIEPFTDATEGVTKRLLGKVIQNTLSGPPEWVSARLRVGWKIKLRVIRTKKTVQAPPELSKPPMRETRPRYL